MQVVRDAAMPRAPRCRAAKMRRWKGIVAVLAGLLVSSAASAAKHPWEDYDKRLEASRSPAALGSDLFGDSVNLQDGALSFSVTDVSLPGNSALPVAFSRSYRVFSRKDYGDLGVLADWDLELPRISASTATEWLSSTGGGNRCSDTNGTQAAPPGFEKHDYFQGLQLQTPGTGGGELLIRHSTTAKPTDGKTYPWMTEDQIHVSCLTSIGNRTGEGFLAVTPDGTKVWFDWMAQDALPVLSAADFDYSGRDTQFVLVPKKTSLYATRVEDKNGNWVQYNYGNAWNQTVQLNSITSSDGRQITVTYAGGRVSTVSNGSQTWQYQYGTTTSGRGTLTAVVQPDASRWAINFAAFTNAEIRTTEAHEMAPGEIYRTCKTNEIPLNVTDQPVGSLTHPSGATGTFTMAIEQHGLSNVPVSCGNFGDGDTNWLHGNNPNDDTNLFAMKYYAFSLTDKAITGPGLSGSAWSYTYSPTLSWFWAGDATMSYPVCTLGAPCYERQVCSGGPCPGSAITTVTGPNGTWERYEFGNSFKYNEGKLLSVMRGSGPTDVLETTVNTYDLSLTAQAYPASFGQSQRGNDAFAATYHRPLVKRDTTRQGVTFTWQIETCNTTFCTTAQVHPTKVRRHSTLGFSRTEITAYWNDYAKWIIGLPATVTCDPAVPADAACDGDIVEQNTYDPLGRPITRTEFGKLQHTLTYNAEGTLATFKDGRNLVTTLSSWYRGVPRSIGYPDGTSDSATVNSTGTIASTTDENGFTTDYVYDAMDRLARIDYPTGDTTAWNDTHQTFAQIGTVEYGIPAGHWRQTVNTGNGTKVVYFDAMWRPLLIREYDAGNLPSTERFVRYAYDGNGRTAFASYPSITSNPTTGIWTLYDALGRPTSMSQDSELGFLLNTTTTYLPGFLTQVTNPAGFQTTTSYKAFDTPTTDWPISIEHPEQVRTSIQRDAFGKPLWIKRWSTLAGQPEVTRWYVYDVNQQLCKTIEPETGSTVMAYDGAGNLAWSASGQALTSTTLCETASVLAAAKVARTYDLRNRLTTLDFPDDNGDQAWSYTADGLPLQVITTNKVELDATTATNAFTYNKRRLLTGEGLSQSQPEYAWSIGYGYNANGHLESHTYPGGLSVTYAPNALGQSTQAGTYATGASYYPTGAIAQFTYGNGIVHQMTPNARQLPMRSFAAYGTTEFLDDYYDYDANGNVAAISDGLAGSGGRGNRTMTYDDLDRLETADSPMFGGVASYTYDALDNLKHVVAPGRDHQYHYIDGTNRLTSVTNTVGGETVIGLDYDVQGNLRIKNGVEHHFDLGNRLRLVEGKELYRYDAHGRRIQATDTVTSEGIFSFYGQDGVLRYQRDQGKDENVQYVYLAGSLVAEVADALVLPSSPVLSATPLTSHDGAFAVSWNATNASRYSLEESANGGSTWTEMAGETTTGWNATGKAYGSYQYRVRACDVDCSAYSNVVTVTVAPPPPDTPALTVPTQGLNGDYTVSWTSETGSVHYELKEGTVATNVGAALNKVFVDRAAGTYAYQVRACNQGGCSTWSASDSVQVIYPPPVPTLTAPAQGLNGDYTVTWSGAAGATYYELMEGTAIANVGVALSKAYVDRTAGTYTYQVRACNQAGCSAWSASDSVQVIYPPSVPTLSAPAQGLNGDYTVSWTSAAGSTYYELMEGAAVTNVGLTLSKAFVDRAAGTYAYQVRACNQAGCSAWSAVDSVQVIYPPAAPTLTAPTYGLNGDYTVSWTGAAGSTYYELMEGAAVTNVGLALSKVFVDRAAGTYAYQVRACNQAGCSAWSAGDSVQVIYPPSVPALTVPAQGLNGDYTVSWTGAAGSTYYELMEGAAVTNVGLALSKAFVDRAAGTYAYQVRACNQAGCSAWSASDSVQVIYPPSVPALTVPTYGLNGDYTVSWTSAAGSTRYELTEGTVVTNVALALSKAFVDRAAGTYSYQVRACNQAGCSAWSAADSVQVIYPPAVPTLTAPTYGLNGDYTVSWTGASGSTRYELMEGAVVTNVGLALSKAFVDRAPGSYAYQVRACNLAGCSAWSASDSVQVIYPPAVPALTVPTYGPNGDYTVSWSSAAGSTYYELMEGGVATNVGLALSKAWVDRAAGTFTYQVRACNQAGCSAWSASGSVQVLYPPGATTISVPAQGLSGDYTVSWAGSAGAHRYELLESFNGSAWSEVYDGAALSKAFVDRAIGTYTYQVRACNPAGCSAWSAAGSVQVIYPPATAPTLTAPTEDADGSYTISWTAVSSATSYRVQELYPNDDTWLTSPALTGTSKAYSGKSPGVYQYKVYACNVAGCGPTSPIKSVNVLPPPPPPPPPATPTGLLVEKPTGMNACWVSWNAVSGATSYEILNQSIVRYTGSNTYYRQPSCSGGFQVRACNSSACSAWSGSVYPSAQ